MVPVSLDWTDGRTDGHLDEVVVPVSIPHFYSYLDPGAGRFDICIHL